MSILASFFKGSGTRFGVFFPKNYIVAMFSDLERARQAESRLRDFGFSEEEVVAVPGEDVLRLAQEHVEHKGFWAIIMQDLSRVIATEETYNEVDLDLASQGAALLAVHCPNEETKQNAWNLIRPSHPIVARHYANSGIDHLVGDPVA
jgi:hypothetical protein